MKLEKIIIQDGAAYEFTGEYRQALPDEPFLSDWSEKIYWCKNQTGYHPIYKLIAPATLERDGNKYKFTGKIDMAGEDECYYYSGTLYAARYQVNKLPIYTLIEEKKEDTPPPFIKQGEDYFLYVKTDYANRGDYARISNGKIYKCTLDAKEDTTKPGKFPIYEKLPLKVLQDGVLYVFTGEYRQVIKKEFYYYNKNIVDWCGTTCLKSDGLYPIYITFEDFYWKKYPAMDAVGKKYAKTPIDKKDFGSAVETENLNKIVQSLHSEKVVSDAKVKEFTDFIKYGGVFL